MMRILWFALLILLVLWIVAPGLFRKVLRRPEQPTSSPPPSTTDVVACDVCKVHIPAANAIRGHQGVYCCAEHRNEAERA